MLIQHTDHSTVHQQQELDHMEVIYHYQINIHPNNNIQLDCNHHLIQARALHQTYRHSAVPRSANGNQTTQIQNHYINHLIEVK